MVQSVLEDKDTAPSYFTTIKLELILKIRRISPQCLTTFYYKTYQMEIKTD